MSELDLYMKLSSLPDDLKKEVADFIDLLKKKKIRPAGLAKGLIVMKPDFDEPLEDFKEYM